MKRNPFLIDAQIHAPHRRSAQCGRVDVNPPTAEAIDAATRPEYGGHGAGQVDLSLCAGHNSNQPFVRSTEYEEVIPQRYAKHKTITTDTDNKRTA